MTPVPRTGGGSAIVARWSSFIVRPVVLVGLAAGAFVVVALVLSGIRILELSPTAYDLGLYQQALWSGGHGGPFFDAPDAQTSGYPSFLYVQTSGLLFAIAPLYAALPSPLTLVLLQAGIVASAAFPLYGLVLDAERNPRLALGVALLYLAWAPLVAGAVFDFHLESFVPLELFTLVWLWQRREYALAGIPVLAAFLTGQFAIVFVGLVGAWLALRPAPRPDGTRRSIRSAARVWADDRGRWGALLIVVASGVAYVLLGLVRTQWLPEFVGAPPPAVSGTPAVWDPRLLAFTFGLDPVHLLDALPYKLGAWVLVLALVGFLPLLAPRSWVMLGPWFGFTLLATSATLTLPGFQYEFLTAGPLFLGVAESLPRLRRMWGRIGSALENRPSKGGPLRRRRILRPSLPALAGLCLLAANVAVSPLDPVVQFDPAFGAGYGLDYSVQPGYADVAGAASLLSRNAEVLASMHLFPLVSDDRNAYVLTGSVAPGGFEHLPFGPYDLPPNVFLCQSDLLDVPTWLSAALYDVAVYHLVAVAWASPVGSVFLFERAPFPPGATGSVESFGPAPGEVQQFSPTSLSLGPAGLLVPTPGSGVPLVESTPGIVGTVWFGPYATLSRGAYVARLEIQAEPSPGSPTVPNGTAPILQIQAQGFAQPPWNATTVSFENLSSTSYTEIDLPFVVPEDTPNVEIVGTQLTFGAEIELRSLEIAVGP